MSVDRLARRALLGGMAVGAASSPLSAFARALPEAGPFATTDRDELFRRFAHYLALVDEGEAGQKAYLVAGMPITRPDRPQRITLRTLAMDDGGGLMGAELRCQKAPGESRADPEFQLRFYRLVGGYIAEVIPVARGARLIPGAGAAGALPSPQADLPLPDTIVLPRMTRAKFADYLKLFGRFDERFTAYYADDVTFTASPAPAPLHGREAILQLYRPLRANLGEDLTVHQLVIDNPAGLMMASVTNRLTAFGDVRLPSRTLRAGDQMVLSGGLVYGLRDGRISLIRDIGG